MPQAIIHVVDPKDAQPGDVVYTNGEYGTIREVGIYYGSILEYYVEFADRFETITSDDVEEVRRI
jgi:hypothetical protein